MPEFIKRKNKVNGPFSTAQVEGAIKSGKIYEDDEISSSENGPWTKISHRIAGNSDDRDLKGDSVEDWLGISSIAVAPKKKQEPEIAHSTPAGSSTTKRCPFCVELIAKAARKCKHCGEYFDQEEPQSGLKSFTWHLLGMGVAIATAIVIYLVINAMQEAHIRSLQNEIDQVIKRARN
jgi:uncharacterized protein (DUF983 family)